MKLKLLPLLLCLLLLAACSAKSSDSEPTELVLPELVTTPDEGTNGTLSYSNPILTLIGVSANTAKFFNAHYVGVHDEYSRMIRSEAAAGSISLQVHYEQRALTPRLISILRTCRVEHDDGSVIVIPESETFDPQPGPLQNAQIFFICPIDVADARVCDMTRAALEAGDYFGFASQEQPVLRDDWADRLELVHRTENFVLTESGYLVFFAPGKLSEDAIGVYLPYKELQDILVLPQ